QSHIGHHGASIVGPAQEVPQRLRGHPAGAGRPPPGQPALLPHRGGLQQAGARRQVHGAAGHLRPLPNAHNEKLVSFNLDRIKYWMGCGAHPSPPVAKLLGLAGFFPLHPMTVTAAERLKAQDSDLAPGAESEPQQQIA
ncbi:hypothetical protein NHX12_029611, partial [Muraenolepis orangiensis]